MRSKMRRKTAIRDMEKLLLEFSTLVDAVLVEGPRDTQALRYMGYVGVIEALSRSGVNDFDLSDELASKHGCILLLLDFDEEGLNLNNHFTQLLERKGVKVEYGLRKEFSRLMAEIGVYAIESLDNIRDHMDQ